MYFETKIHALLFWTLCEQTVALFTFLWYPRITEADWATLISSMLKTPHLEHCESLRIPKWIWSGSGKDKLRRRCHRSPVDGRKKKTWSSGACMSGSALGGAGLPQGHHLPLLSLSLDSPLPAHNSPQWHLILSTADSRERRSAWPLQCPLPQPSPTAALFLVLAYLPTLCYLTLRQLDQVQ